MHPKFEDGHWRKLAKWTDEKCNGGHAIIPKQVFKYCLTPSRESNTREDSGILRCWPNQGDKCNDTWSMPLLNLRRNEH